MSPGQRSEPSRSPQPVAARERIAGRLAILQRSSTGRRLDVGKQDTYARLLGRASRLVLEDDKLAPLDHRDMSTGIRRFPAHLQVRPLRREIRPRRRPVRP